MSGSQGEAAEGEAPSMLSETNYRLLNEYSLVRKIDLFTLSFTFMSVLCILVTL